MPTTALGAVTGAAAAVIRQLQEETDPSARRAQEEAEVDIDQLFDSVCPQCREPISVA